MNNQVAVRANIEGLVAEYDEKIQSVPQTLRNFKDAIGTLAERSSVAGTYGSTYRTIFPPHESEIEKSLKVSAWRKLYGIFEPVMTAKDKSEFDRTIADPPDFTFETIVASFGKYVENPRYHILRGLAEVFCSLDPAYKSHNKVKIGTDRLPKKIIIREVFSDYFVSSGKQEQVLNVLNALRLYQGRGPLKWCDVEEMEPIDGVSFKKFANGNIHIIFDKDCLKDINKALAEFYGDVLPDTVTPGEEQKSSLPSKDLQFYPTPQPIIKKMLWDVHFKPKAILEPSCGDGRMLMESIREYPEASRLGIEIDLGRVNECRNKGLPVMHANFLEVEPPSNENEKYDLILMNPPFYGRHFLKHLEKATEWLSENGLLVALLPATAWYDYQDELPTNGIRYGAWRDNPIGSFRESGTNVNTGIWKYKKP